MPKGEGQVRSHCRSGHPWAPETIYWATHHIDGGLKKYRICKLCRREREKRYTRENREELLKWELMCLN